MADIVVSIPNDQVARAVDALCEVGGYSGAPGDQSARREFARGVMCDFIRRTVRQVENQKALADARSGVTIDPITVE